MSFINPVLLFFLPFILVPLLLAFIARLNRKKQQFPSLELLQDIIRNEPAARKLRVRLKQVLRAIVLLAAVLAFAQPFFGTRSFRPDRTVAVIDPTLSMGRFALKNLVRHLREDLSIEKIYFGKNLLGMEGNEIYSFDALQAGSYIQQVLLSENRAENLVLVSDGQACNFREPVKVPNRISRFQIIRPETARTVRNLSVREISVFPGILFPGDHSEFLVTLNGKVEPSDRIRITVNGREIYSERAGEKTAFNRVMDNQAVHSGLNVGKIELEGDDFTNDNVYYFPLISLPRPSVYSDIDSQVITKIFSSIFPEYYVSRDPVTASVLFTGRFAGKSGNKPVFIFSEEMKTSESILRNSFRELAEFSDRTAEGPVISSNDVLSLIKDVKILTKFRLKDEKRLLASAGGVPLAYRFNNNFMFTFPVRDNEDYFSDSPSLLLMVNEFLMGFYRELYLLPESDPSLLTGRFYDEKGDPVRFADTIGILKGKDGGKSAVHNVTDESDFQFLTDNDLKKRVTGIGQDRVGVSSFQADSENKFTPGLIAGSILMLLAIALAILEWI